MRLIFLGGLGEVGKNIAALEYGNDIIVVDCGIGFPTNEMLGVDMVLPDITYLAERKDKIRAIFITHGHEDHIGSLPYLLPQLDAPIYATRLAIGLISVKLKEHKLLDNAKLNVVEAGSAPIKAGAFAVEFFHIVHSIPDSCGLGIHTPVGTIVHTGDFKFDLTPTDGWRADFGQIAHLGNEGVLALLSECVHVETEGTTPSEQEVKATFDRLFRKAEGRVIIATFGSLIARVQIALDLAYKHGRKVAVLGRSMENNVAMAVEMGYLQVPEDTLIKISEARDLALNKVVVVITGSQGEPSSVLTRIANQENRFINVIPGDTIIVSSTPIPGNEVAIIRVINSLLEQGADVYYSQVARVHVSGHASQEELKMMISLTRPHYIVPIHGERRHMVAYAKMAAEMGIKAENIFICGNGSVLEFTADSATAAEPVRAGALFVDGGSISNIGDVVLRDRQNLSRDGVMTIAVSIDSETGELAGEPDIVSRGFVEPETSDDLLNRVREVVRNTVKLEREAAQVGDWPQLNRRIKEAVSQFLFVQTKRRPMLLPMIVEV
ncbi:MAG: ribonuclease J [Candidatus Chloroheliales bacterium]|nr:MAG: ribonuclease J [Chloroflexota bacterium]